MKLSYLKPNVIIEPLVSNWYAWIHLVSPLTAGFHFKNRYIKLLDSFIEHQALHQEASKNQHLIGGLFVNLDDEQYEQAKKLLNKMNFDLELLFKLAAEIQELNKKIISIKSGSSLEPLYRDVPSILRGAVELIYDINNRASIRYIENIIYKRFYNPMIQSFLFSVNNNIKNRPFVLSTPRLKKCEEVEIKIPFNNRLIDEIISSRENGLDLQNFIAHIPLSEKESIFFHEMFTDNKPLIVADRKYTGKGVRVRYFGHACVLIQTNTTSILIDPLVQNDAHRDNSSYSYFDIPEIIDAVFITHAHQDHLVLETLLQLRNKIRRIIVPRNSGGSIEDPSIKIMLEHMGFDFVEYFSEFDSLVVGDILVRAIPFLGEHGDLNIQSKLAYYVLAKAQSFLFAVDSNNIDPCLYESIGDMVGLVDTLFIGMECNGAPYSWTYGPLSPSPIKRENDQSRRLSGSDSFKAWNITLALGAKNAYVYAMGLEPWLLYLVGLSGKKASFSMEESDRFIRKCLQNDINSKRLYLKEEFIYE